MSDAKTELDALQKGILDALNGGEAVSTTPAAPDSGMQLAYQKKLLDCAKKMNAFYQYLNGDAESVQNLEKTILEEVADGLAFAKDLVTRLDTTYAGTLLPGLAANLKAAGKIKDGFGTIVKLSENLASDIHQSDDQLFAELLVGLVAEEENKTAAADKNKEIIKKEIPKEKDPFKIRLIEQNIKSLYGELEKYLSEDFLTINIPSAKNFYDQTDAAHKALVADLTQKLEALGKEEDAALAGFQQLNGLKPDTSLSADIAELKKLIKVDEDAPDQPLKKKTTPLEEAEKAKMAAEQKLKGLESQLGLEKAEQAKIEEYKVQFSSVGMEIKALRLGLEDLKNIIADLRAKDDDKAGKPQKDKKANLGSVYDKLNVAGQTMITELNKLSGVKSTISGLNEKFSAVEVVSDVKEYVKRINDQLEALTAPGIDFVKNLVANAQTLKALIGLADVLDAVFSGLSSKFEKSSLEKAPEKMKAVAAVFEAPKEDKKFNTSIPTLQSEIDEVKTGLSDLVKTYEKEKNKDAFLKSIQ